MLARLFGSLRSRLLVLLVITVFLATALAGTFSVLTLRHEAEKSFDEKLQYEAYELSSFARKVLLAARDNVPPEEAWESLAGHKILEESLEHDIRLLDAGFNALLASGSMQSAPPLREPRSMTFQSYIQDYTTEIRIFTFAIDDLGYVQVGNNFDIFADMLSDDVLIAGWGIALATLLAMLIGWWWAGTILMPVQLLTKAAAAAELKDLNKRIQYHGSAGDELHELAQTFDRMLDRLATSAQKLRQFTSDASHELRTPITALRLAIDVALHEKSKASYASTLVHAKTELTQLSTLIERLLLLARADSSALQEHMQAVDLQTIIQHVEHTLMPVAADKHVHIQTKAPSVIVRGDPELLQQAIANVVQNAIQHAPQKSTVHIALQIHKKRADVTVTDSGPGISQTDHKKIFDRFYRRDSSRTGSSTGLGLAITNEIIHAHGGSVRVQRTASKGAVFSVSLPRS